MGGIFAIVEIQLFIEYTGKYTILKEEGRVNILMIIFLINKLIKVYLLPPSPLRIYNIPYLHSLNVEVGRGVYLLSLPNMY